jgi:hypothetical protein
MAVGAARASLVSLCRTKSATVVQHFVPTVVVRKSAEPNLLSHASDHMLPMSGSPCDSRHSHCRKGQRADFFHMSSTLRVVVCTAALIRRGVILAAEDSTNGFRDM